MLWQSPLCLTFKRLDTEVTATVYPANNSVLKCCLLIAIAAIYLNAF